MKWERHSMAYFILFIFSAHPDPSESLFKATEVTLGVSGAISVSGLGLALWILKRLKRKGESNSLLSFWTCSNSLIIYWKWIEMLNYVFLFPANKFDLNRWDVFFFLQLYFSCIITVIIYHFWYIQNYICFCLFYFSTLDIEDPPQFYKNSVDSLI